MRVLPQKNDACVSLLLLSDDPSVAEDVCNAIREPAFKIGSASLSEMKFLAGYASQNDVILAHVDQINFDTFIQHLKSDGSHGIASKTIIIDNAASPERAVKAMKAGAIEYLANRTGDAGDYIDQVVQCCHENLLTTRGAPTSKKDGATTETLMGLYKKIQKTVNAAKALAKCDTLNDVCETLLETIGQALGATGGSLYLMKEGYLELVHSLDPGHAQEQLALPLEKGTIFEQVLASGEPTLFANDARFRKSKLSGWDGYESDSVLVYPLYERSGSLIGLFSLHGKQKSFFTQQDQDLALILASYSHETIRSLLAQERSRKAFDSLQLTFDNMNEGILLLDQLGNIAQFNQNVATIIGIPNDFLSVDQNISHLYEYLFTRGDLSDKLEGKCPWFDVTGNYEYLHFCSNGTIANVLGNVLPTGGYVLTFTDITKQKNWESELYQAKEQAEAASASKTNFLANVSHELRTPLNAIIGFSEMMTKQIYGPIENEKYAEYVQYIYDSGAHLLRLINNLLDLSKVEAGKFELHMGPVELPELMHNTGTYLSHQAQEAGVDLVLNDVHEAGSFWGDENALRQIFLNLISNAIKFTPKGGKVAVSVEFDFENKVKITIADNGIGMEEKSIDLALQPFGQIENAFNRKYPGTGLGLPLVASLSELHGGHLEIESALGKGTTCSVHLPLAQAPMH
ncbi:hypothetical protein A9Q83_03780 [Alphaproteobacteria bacterium 46_93_T64]|nr:hypothetical protein A9Q83_03780 [Alphaproteobacteria bacterium 46_93_T64]